MQRRDLLARGGMVLGGAMLAAGGVESAQAAPQAPFGKLISAASYGAVGDGIADDTVALQAGLDAAYAGDNGGLLLIPPGRYRITATLRIAPKQNVTRQSGILGIGARLISSITDGSDILEIASHSTFRFLLIQGLDIHGSGKDGHGIRLACPGNKNFLYNFCLRDLVVQGCGKNGCQLIGNVFEGQITNCYFRNNHGHGASFHHDPGGKGILSAVRVIGGVFGENGIHGAAMLDGCYDVSYHGSYFLLNKRFGLVAENGCTLLSSCGFENNHEGADDFSRGDAGIWLQGFATLVGCTAYSMFKQTHLLRAILTGRLVMVGCSGSGDAKAAGAGLAVLRGDPRSTATVVGCSGNLRSEGGFEAIEIGNGGDGGGLKVGGDWQSRTLAQLGEYRLWVDRQGRLRIKKGRPQHDDDGSPVGVG
ncbi:glycosyl hydrolase family 28-related protein [Ferrovibrio terrae]|uniref:glycosyl hydrolase family 28-related protein n=1 Tax=Ferrovibrio terrae TaxID=2594003 RepID=UPI00313844E8